MTLKTGTYLFFAPELFDVKKRYTYGAPTDIWALGLTFYYLLTGVHPFQDVCGLEQIMKTVPSREINMELIRNIQARHCIARMLDKNPETRATIDELLKMDWATNSGREPVNVTIVDKS